MFTINRYIPQMWGILGTGVWFMLKIFNVVGIYTGVEISTYFLVQFQSKVKPSQFLPSQSIELLKYFRTALNRLCAPSIELALIPKSLNQRLKNMEQVWCFHKLGDSHTEKQMLGARSLTRLSKSRRAACFIPHIPLRTS